MKFKSVLMLTFALIFSACSLFDGNSENLDELYTVKGRISDSGGVIRGAVVTIDNAANWTTKTSETGDFSIREVTKGSHSLKITNSAAQGEFVEIAKTLEVYSDIDLENLVLPKPVTIQNPVNLSVSSMDLIWSSTDSDDFTEYKVFMKDDPGLDENTGELIYISTDKQDTTFTVTGLVSGRRYYFRVYIMNNYGRIGGSNMINVATFIGNLIPDGDFENENSLSEYWYISRNGDGDFETRLDGSTKVGGQYSLYNKNPEPVDYLHPTQVKLDLIPIIKLGANIRYELSCYYKYEGKATNDYPIVLHDSQYNEIHIDHPFAFWSEADSVSMDWRRESIVFLQEEDKEITIQLSFPIQEMWVDSLSLTPLVVN